MAQTQELSQETVSPKPKVIYSKKLGTTHRRKAVPLTITPEEAAAFKGRYPTGIKDQIVAITEQKQDVLRAEERKVSTLRRKQNGAVVQQRKLEAFLEEFLKNGGNATAAAAAVFDVSSRMSAGSIGSYYLKKAKTLGRLYLEEKGYSYGRLLSIAAEKAETSRLPDWWDRVYEISGYGSFRSAKDGGSGPVTNINIVQTEKELFKKYSLEGEVIDEDETADDLEKVPDEVEESEEQE